MKTILYLEDDGALAFVTQRALQKRGFEVVHFADMESLEINLEHYQFDCALLDLKIGNQTSLKLIEEIHKKNSTIPIVILTGYGSIRTAVEAMRLGAVNFLSKPSSISSIISALENQETSTEESIDLQAPSLKNQEWEAIQQALLKNDGNISATARQLKMHRRTLQRKLQKKQLP